jgi:adenylyltransferase/sulfurtransferase
MPNTIHIPTPLRPFTDKKESVDVSGGTVGELLADLTKQYDGLRKHLYTDEGKLRNFVNVYLNDEDIRYLEREKTPVKPGDSLSIVPSVAGGAGNGGHVSPKLPAEVRFQAQPAAKADDSWQ